MTSSFLVTTEPETRYENPHSVSLPWQCGFGESVSSPDWCYIEQYKRDHGDWVAWEGLSPGPHTGPPADGTGRYG